MDGLLKINIFFAKCPYKLWLEFFESPRQFPLGPTELSMARVLSLFWPQPFLATVGGRKPTLCKMSIDSRARKLFAAAVEAVQPDTVVRQSVERKEDSVIINDHKFTLKNNLYLVGFGKAVLGMAAETERIMGDHLVKGIISVPHGIQQTLQQHGKK